MLNPTSATYSNTMAGQIVALSLNITFDSLNASFAPSGVLFRNAVLTTGPFAGWTVAQLYSAANTAIGCGGTKTYLSDLTTALDFVNNSWSDGIQRNTYVACPTGAAVRTTENVTATQRSVVYPNPTSGRVSISYEMPDAGKAVFEVFSLTGQRVASREVEHSGAGIYNVEFSLRDESLSPGLYLIRVIKGDVAEDLRIMLSY